MTAFYLISRSVYNTFRVLLLATIVLSCHDDEKPALPEVTSINPDSAEPNSLIAISGKFFSASIGENKVSFNGADAIVANASATQLNVIVPQNAVTGPVTVTVNGKPAVNQPIFTVQSLPTVVNSISPLTGKYNTLITISGSNFRTTPGGNVVTFNGVFAVVESASATGITVRVPERSGTGPVIVNGSVAAGNFKYVPEIFLAGVVSNGTHYIATVWKDGIPTALAPPGQHSYANDIAVSGSDVYVVGSRNTGPFLVAKFWKNNVEIPLTDEKTGSTAVAVAVIGNDVYIGGMSTNAKGTQVPTYWKNGVRTTLTDGTALTSVIAMAVSGDDVYIAGGERLANGVFVATYWKNGVVNHITDEASTALAIFVQGNDVHVTGFVTNGVATGIATYWKNGAPQNLTGGTNRAGGLAITAVADDVYIAGHEDNAYDIRVARYWKNGVPTLLSSGVAATIVNSISVLGDDVYVGGLEYNLEAITVAKYWKNGVPVTITDGSQYANLEGIVVR